MDFQNFPNFVTPLWNLIHRGVRTINALQIRLCNVNFVEGCTYLIFSMWNLRNVSARRSFVRHQDITCACLAVGWNGCARSLQVRQRKFILVKVYEFPRFKFSFKYTVIEKEFNEAFQALWIELNHIKSANVICGVLYRQHNPPERFLNYFEETIEKLSNRDKPIYIMCDTNINLLQVDKCKCAQNLMSILQSYNLIPCIDKPTRVIALIRHL